MLNLTTFTLGDKVPIDNPRLHSTEKLKEENSIRQALILEKSQVSQHQKLSSMNYGLNNNSTQNAERLVYLNLKTLHSRSSARAFNFVVSPL